MSLPWVDLSVARELLDFQAGRITPARADAQLEGAVAIHNLLREHSVAYLADEVGMGKTYVALGALALFRHFDPTFRVLILAPRKNIQDKWEKEARNFTSNNVRVSDLRVRSVDGRPARSHVNCGNLLELVRETSLDPDRDFFARMTSFSLSVGDDGQGFRQMRDALRMHLPWLNDEAFDLRSKEDFKKNFARALCCALPVFDLVIVDEAHNFKHGYSTHGSARNQVLGTTFGRDAGADAPNPRWFPGYGPRAKRVLFLSATPLEETYRHVWNQLDLFGRSAGFDALRRDDVGEDEKKKVAAQFLVRRVTSMRVGDKELTKNLYRREWRAGGVAQHDDPIAITDERQRLVVALVQKKVSELLSGKRFNRSFQIGMLASFESFLQTARLKRDDEESVFDDAEQTDVEAERDGLDVHDLNRLARDYAKKFDGQSLPHPKMDAVVDSLASAWATGRKALVFVRRVASVRELKRKLDERYDRWLLGELRGRLPASMHGELDTLERAYRKAKEETGVSLAAPVDVVGGVKDEDDTGGNDTFFAWYFRGDGPPNYVSGANIQARFIKPSGAYATFFADNHVMELLGARPGGAVDALAAALSLSRNDLVAALTARAARYVSRKAQRVTRGAAMEAMQGAALELLREHEGPHAHQARVIWAERYESSLIERGSKPLQRLSEEHLSHLERPTFFTELRLPEWRALRAALWPEPASPSEDPAVFRTQFRERELRAQFLATTARLGHAFIDLYLVAMEGRTSLRRGGENIEQAATSKGDDALIDGYLRMLDGQRLGRDGRWGAFRELSELSEHFDLIIDVNAPDARPSEGMALSQGASRVAQLLRQQMPTGGMAGHLNKTLIGQFRMPGYPFVLVTTDLLQEGEDLHTFCSSVHHYGISWTPSAMEQRIGRIDRVRSQTDRRLAALPNRDPEGSELLQVYFPYLNDTVEVLQVERVLDRMNTFLRLMHDGLAVPVEGQHRIDVGREMVAGRKRAHRITEVLKSAFPVPAHALKGDIKALAVTGEVGKELTGRFDGLRGARLPGVDVEWAESSGKGTLLGTAKLASGRQQPFALGLHAEQGHPVVRCVSPIGRTDAETDPASVVELAKNLASRIGAIPGRQAHSYDLTVEDDVLLVAKEHDAVRVGMLIRCVVEQADAIEQEHFADGRDEPLDLFAADLQKEGATDE